MATAMSSKGGIASSFRQSVELPPLPPLAVGGLVVSRAALVAALRLYVPQLADVRVLDDGRFLLHLADDSTGVAGERNGRNDQ